MIFFDLFIVSKAKLEDALRSFVNCQFYSNKKSQYRAIMFHIQQLYAGATNTRVLFQLDKDPGLTVSVYL